MRKQSITDKYEGHSEGEWVAVNGSVIIPANEVSEEQVTINTRCAINARLIADTPLLLEEVKRLRKGMKMMLDDMNNASPEEDIKYWLDTWKHWLKEMIE